MLGLRQLLEVFGVRIASGEELGRQQDVGLFGGVVRIPEHIVEAVGAEGHVGQARHQALVLPSRSATPCVLHGEACTPSWHIAQAISRHSCASHGHVRVNLELGLQRKVTVSLRLCDDFAHGSVHVEVGDIRAGKLSVEIVDDLQEAFVEVERGGVGLVIAHAVSLQCEGELEGAASDGG